MSTEDTKVDSTLVAIERLFTREVVGCRRSFVLGPEGSCFKSRGRIVVGPDESRAETTVFGQKKTVRSEC